MANQVSIGSSNTIFTSTELVSYFDFRDASIITMKMPKPTDSKIN